MQIELIKGHGSGNDFLLIDETMNDYAFTDQDRADLARLLCKRDTELGADGILFILNSTHAEGKMRVFNADGSEASMCGNGLRLVARYVCEQQGIHQAVIETMKADLHVARKEDLFPEVVTYQVEISPVSFKLSDLPLRLEQETLRNEGLPGLSDELIFTALAVPNPHLISLVETEHLHSDLQTNLSEEVNGPNQWFPDGVNVSFVKPIKPGSIYVRTYERGVGFTNACGTAMSASSLVSCLNGVNVMEEVINVYNDGGKVQCVVHESSGTYSIDLIGNATYLYKAQVDVDLGSSHFTLVAQSEFFEQTVYEKIKTEVHEVLTEVGIKKG